MKENLITLWERGISVIQDNAEYSLIALIVLALLVVIL